MTTATATKTTEATSNPKPSTKGEKIMPKTTAEKKVTEKEEVAQETTKKERCPTCGKAYASKKYSRAQAAVDAVKALGKDADLDDLSAKATELYVANGGNANGKNESEFMEGEIKRLRATMAMLKEKGISI